jgi:hypothetical protein
MSPPARQTAAFLDVHGRAVHRFTMEMANLGLARFGETLIAMLDSDAWHQYQDGLGTYRFLPGEFDYFLSQAGVDREHVMQSVQDLDAKARLEKAMDERRTGENGYRRGIQEVRRTNPERPGRPIVPYGYTAAERKALVEAGTTVRSRQLPALGHAVRRFATTGTTKSASEERPRWERLVASLVRLPDDELAQAAHSIKSEQARRRRHTR